MNISSTTPACTVAMVLAMDNNKLIGKENGMPWHIPGEQVYFKSVTMGKPIVMGRKTFDSIGKPLPGRPNFVVTRNTEWSFDGVQVFHSLHEAIDGAMQFYAQHDAVATAQHATAQHTGNATTATQTASPELSTSPEVMVIGGAGLCRGAMPITKRIYLTHIDHEYEGDIWFDSFNWDDWQVVSKKDMQHDELKFSYLVLERQ